VIDPGPRRERAVEIDGVELAPLRPGLEGTHLLVTGRWTRGWPPSPAPPALLVGDRRLEAVSAFEDGRDDRWQASFAVPEALRPALTHELALDVAGSRIALPAPAGPDGPGADVVDQDVLVDRRAARQRAEIAAVADEERTRATGGAVLDLVALAGRTLDAAEQRIEDVQAAARELEVEHERERAERALYEAALQRRIGDPVAAQAGEPEQRRLEQLMSGLRERLDALEERVEQELGAPAPPPGGWSALALVDLATADAQAAGRLAVSFLPVQARAAGLELDADVVLAGEGAWRVAASPDGALAVPLDAPRGRGEADFRITAEPAAFVGLLAGRRRLRGRPRIRVRGSRRRARRLRGLATTAPVGLGEALRARVDIGAELAWRAVAAAIAPAWTAGARFTVAFEPDAVAPFYVHAKDGAPIAVDDERGRDAPAAAIRGSARAIVATLAGEQPDAGDKVSIRGELAAVQALRDWVERARDRARETA